MIFIVIFVEFLNDWIWCVFTQISDLWRFNNLLNSKIIYNWFSEVLSSANLIIIMTVHFWFILFIISDKRLSVHATSCWWLIIFFVNWRLSFLFCPKRPRQQCGIINAKYIIYYFFLLPRLSMVEFVRNNVLSIILKNNTILVYCMLITHDLNLCKECLYLVVRMSLEKIFKSKNLLFYLYLIFKSLFWIFSKLF